jgi:lipoprotein-anchoring transpeptidase ErfK/SrfK
VNQIEQLFNSRFAIMALVGLTSVFVRANVSALPAGEFTWNPEFSASGPLVIIISLHEQTLSAYRNGIRIARSSISSGRKGRTTPAGVFTVLEKEVTHYSNKYHHAPMPYMQRLTWQGIALHGGDLPGYPASHGCIRLPKAFAKLLYSITTRGTTVIVMGEKAPEPTLAAQPGMIWWPKEAGAMRPIEGTFEWTPERSPEGPITILASAADKTVYVYRNGKPIGRAVLQIENPNSALGSYVFTMLSGLSEQPSAFVRGRPAHQWMAVETEGKTTLAVLGRRVRIPPEFAEKVYDLVLPGTTIVVTDAPALPSTSSPHEVPLMEAEQK